jgi:Tol biopolymer transport system component/DNA-binding winged helix-turn-helix (wHTH) protein
MAPPAATPHLVRFGSFEFDLDARELRKSGVRIKLQEQPYLILALLVERPGAIITREALQKKLWPHDTFVDFDLGLNSAVKKLRQALNDDSENPRFVETLYRRGYRFIAPVETVGNSGQAPAVESATPESVAPAAQRRVPRFKIVASAAVLALLLIAAAVLLRVPLPTPRILATTQLTHDNLPKDELVTDGSRLYFNEMVNDHQVLCQVSVEGGEVAQIATPFSDVNVRAISRAASEILVQSLEAKDAAFSTTFSGPLWMIPLPAGAPRRVGTLIAAGAMLSGDGKTLVYTNGGGVYLANADGSDSRKLASVDGAGFHPRFSPDGKRIRFTVLNRNNGSVALWEVNTNGGDIHPLFAAGHEEPSCCGNWTPDGKYYFFMRVRDRSEIWALPNNPGFVRKETPEPTKVTNGPLNYSFPVPSRDGRKLFVVGEQPRGELLRYDRRSMQFVPFLPGLSASQLDFSGDAQFLTYVTFPDGALWRSRADGSEARQLTYGPLIASLPRWSPDGKRIAFCAASSINHPLGAFVISAEGGTPQEIWKDQSRQLSDLNWAPDGNTLIFSRGPTWGGTNPQDFVLVRLDLKNGKLAEVPGSTGLYAPRWSPDGRYLSALPINQDKLMVLEFATGRWTEVANGEVIEYPNWSRDSGNIFFESAVNGARALFRVNLASRRTERVLSLAGVRRPFVSFGSQWSGLAPDDSAVVLRDVGIREIYALTMDVK